MTRRRLSSLCLFPLLAACGGAVVVSNVEQVGLYDPSQVLYAARDGGLPVELRGTPAGVEPDALLRALPLPAWLGGVRPVAAGAADAYRVVLAFGASDAGCRERPPPPAARPQGTLSVQAAFCTGSQPTAALSAHGPVGSGADDPGLGELLSQVMLVLLPASRLGGPGGGSGAGAAGGGGM